MKRIVLTGGPCAGKTTALSRIVDRLESMGHQVAVVPEAATILFQGVTPKDRLALGTQEAIMDLLIALETSIRNAGGEDTVLICDRGALDMKAYAPEHWQRVRRPHGRSDGEMLDRYDAVIHLVTAADGAEEHFSDATNATRVETLDEARDLDKRILRAWMGHPHLRVVPNGMTFEEKIRRAVEEVAAVLGDPVPLEAEHKYVVSAIGAIPVPHDTSRIVQYYLRSGARIRSRNIRGHMVFTETHKTTVGDGVRTEVERRITRKEWEDLRREIDPNTAAVCKDRTCFVWDGQYFEYDVFRDMPLSLLELEVRDLAEPVRLPFFVKVIEEVTHNPRYTNKAQARARMQSLRARVRDLVCMEPGVASNALVDELGPYLDEGHFEVINDFFRATTPEALGKNLTTTLMFLTDAHRYDLFARWSDSVLE